MKEVLSEHQQWVTFHGPEDYCICDYHLCGASIEAHQADMLHAAGFGRVAK